MKKNDIWEVYIPSDKAYGASGSGKQIGPNSTLVFKVELLDIIGGGGAGAGGRAPPKRSKRTPAKPKVQKEEL